MDAEALIARGHHVGGGVCSPQGEWFVLNIPKNASTYITNTLLMNGWQHCNLARGGFKTVIVPLRDPIQRWISGTATYCCSWILDTNYGIDDFCRDFNPLVERLIMDNMLFDDHTFPQHCYVDLIPQGHDLEFLPVDNGDFFHGLTKITGLCVAQQPGIPDNSKHSNHANLVVSDLLRSRLTDDIITRIKTKYHQDYELIKSHHNRLTN